MWGAYAAIVAVVRLLVAATWQEPDASASVEVPTELELSWTVHAPGGCGEAEFRSQLAGLLADTEVETPDGLQVAVALTPRGDQGWVIELRLRGPGLAAEGAPPPEIVRQFEADRCETVVEAAALVVAMTIDPTVADAASPDAPLASPELTAEPDAGESPLRPEPPRRVGAAVQLDAGVTALALPGTTAQFGGGLFVLGRGWRVGVGARGRLGTSARVSGGEEAGGRFRLAAARASACGVPRAGQVEFPLCAVFEVGAILAHGDGISAPARSVRPWLAARIRPGFAYVPRPWLALGLAFDLGVVFSRERYFIESLGPVHRVGPLEPGAVFFLEFRPLAAPQ